LEAARASNQALLVDVPRRRHPSEDLVDFPDLLEPKPVIHTEDQIIFQVGLVLRCSVPFRNVGAGVAVINGAVLRVGTIEWSEPRSTSTIVAPGKMPRLFFSIGMEQPSSPGVDVSVSTLMSRGFEVDVYSSNAGNSRRILTNALTALAPPAKESEQYYVRHI